MKVIKAQPGTALAAYSAGNRGIQKNNQPQTLKSSRSHHSPGSDHQHKNTSRLLLGRNQNLGWEVVPDEVKPQALPKPILQVKRPFK